VDAATDSRSYGLASHTATLSQSSADLIEELQLPLRSFVQGATWQTDWDVRVVAGAGNRDVYLADAKQYPPTSGTVPSAECMH
jgi:hypothetical protein